MGHVQTEAGASESLRPSPACIVSDHDAISDGLSVPSQDGLSVPSYPPRIRTCQAALSSVNELESGAAGGPPGRGGLSPSDHWQAADTSLAATGVPPPGSRPPGTAGHGNSKAAYSASGTVQVTQQCDFKLIWT